MTDPYDPAGPGHDDFGAGASWPHGSSTPHPSELPSCWSQPPPLSAGPGGDLEPPRQIEPGGTSEWVFRNVESWVEGWLAPLINAELSANEPYWCRQWWRHQEAVARLDACWRAWEFYREQTCAQKNPAPAGMSLWWRDHGTPTLELLLTSLRSPFKLCARGQHTPPPPPLPTDPPPAGWSAASISRLH